jgi:hypothetical protein
MAMDPRVLSNPMIAERVGSMLNMQIQAQNAAANTAKTALETETANRERETRKGLIAELTAADRNPTEIQAILQMLDSKNPDGLALAAAAVEQPDKSLSELRQDVRATRLGGVQEQTIQDILATAKAEGRPITRQEAHIQYKKTQAIATVEGTREAEQDFLEKTLGPEGLRLWGAQALFLGKEPTSRNPALANLVKNEEAKIIKEIGKRKGMTLKPEDILDIQGRAKGLTTSYNYQQRWSDVSYNLKNTLERMLPEVMKAYTEMNKEAVTMSAKPLRDLQLYVQQQLKGHEAVQRYMDLANTTAGEYNRVVLGGPLGGGGTPGSMAERAITEALLDPGLPPKSFIGSLNGFYIGAKHRIDAHGAAKRNILKQMGELTGGNAEALIQEPPAIPSILPYLTKEQLNSMTTEDLERMKAAAGGPQ